MKILIDGNTIQINKPITGSVGDMDTLYMVDSTIKRIIKGLFGIQSRSVPYTGYTNSRWLKISSFDETYFTNWISQVGNLAAYRTIEIDGIKYLGCFPVEHNGNEYTISYDMSFMK